MIHLNYFTHIIGKYILSVIKLMSHSARWAESYRTHQLQMTFLKTLPLSVNSSGCLYLFFPDFMPRCRPQIYPDPELEQQILALPIRCIHSEEGCRWTGQMKQLQVRRSSCFSLSLPVIHSPTSVPNKWGRSAERVAGFSSTLRATSPPAPST